MKNPTIATILNVIPGLGYIYLKSRRKFGIAVLAGIIVSIVTSYLNPALDGYYASEYNAWDYLSYAGSILLVGAFMYDGYREAIRVNAVSKRSGK